MSKEYTVILAPDSFKGSLSSPELIRLLEEAAGEIIPGIRTVAVPVADGGEGTADALSAAAGGKVFTHSVTGPLGEPVQARWALLPDDTCVLEMAQAAGLPLVPPELRNPANTTTFGVGTQLRKLLEAGYRKIILGLGGSATNDVGLGFLTALGAVFRDEDGRPLPPVGASLGSVRSADLSMLLPELSNCELIAMCDVTNPLCGPEGAAAVYGPQKGADSAEISFLDQGAASFIAILEKAAGKSLAEVPGAGAAGGLGAAVLAVNGTLKRGIEAMLDAVGFDNLLHEADLVLTGEGRVDGQSLRFGKVIGGIAARCRKSGVPVAVLAGDLAVSWEELRDAGCAAAMPLCAGPISVERSMQEAEELTKSAARRLFSMISLSRRLS